MSTNEGMVVAGAKSPSVPLFRGLQGPHLLPATDGGGIVFPFGFFAPAYYLPEWEFIRYASYLDQLNGHWASLSWWRRQLRGPSRLKVVAIAMLSGLATFHAINIGLLGSETVPSIVAVWFAYSFCSHLIRVYGIWRPRFLSTFPAALPLPLHAYWWEHCRAALVGTTKQHFFQLLRQWILWLGLAAYMIWAYRHGMLPPLIAATMIPVFAAHLIQPPVMLTSLAVMRIRIGRMPTSADLAPVDPPYDLPRA